MNKILFAVAFAAFIQACSNVPAGSQTRNLQASISQAGAANSQAAQAAGRARADIAASGTAVSQVDAKATIVLEWLKEEK